MKCTSVSARVISKATILIAEENYAQACIMKDFMELNGYAVVLADNGASVLSAVEQHEPDVILLDRLLPDVDGVQICRRLKQDQNTNGIPIILLTDKESLSDKVAGLFAGADDYIAKPFNDEELSALICARLRVKSGWDELKQKARNLEDMLLHVENLANMDPLTGLSNRRRIESIIASELKRANRYAHPLSCLMLDVDHFKSVNDTFGHQAGDRVLSEIAGVIRNNIRDVDIAGRWGGEEFLILHPSTEKRNAMLVGEKILKAVSAQKYPLIGNKRITVSIGVAGIPHRDIVSAEQFVHAADLAMYEAKKDGRNRVITSA